MLSFIIDFILFVSFILISLFAHATNDRDRTLVETYVDCLAYGFYTGVTKTASGNPTPLFPLGHSLARVSDTNDNETDFDCGDPATPTNNVGASVNMDATIVECPEPALAFSLVAGIGMLVWLRRRGHRRR